MELFASYTGPQFLIFYAIMLATCVFLGLWIPASLREEGRPGSLENAEEAALLAGGIDRLNMAVLSALFAKGAAGPGGKHTLRVEHGELANSPAERAVAAQVGEVQLREAKKALKIEAERIGARLVRKGLLMRESARRKLRWLSVLPYAVLFAIGLYRQQAGAALGEPTGILIALLAITAAFALGRFFTGYPRTMAGNAAVRRLEQGSSRLKRAPQAGEVGYAVAIFGTSVLVGTPWEPVHAVRQAGTGGDGAGYAGGDSSDSADGGGGCGGGCGGCGG
ncbi:TIGR04222 domain-containing membrane protein [Erythrobacter sp.]|jgi:uncharacterized protein (TIGR04222 family)|uniref:TIGR04222 domain-containing membrane protein n=1 Tax=Erythrobacter sp. TaxID=1042 RepID=UPI002EB34B71|nr:TIGR04222 domain-containing membrane protein [Erythrobacter sp.]